VPTRFEIKEKGILSLSAFLGRVALRKGIGKLRSAERIFQQMGERSFQQGRKDFEYVTA
jgi:hypothetical protein